MDAGSTPARSTNFHKEGPGKAGRIPYEARRRLRTEFAFKCVCSTKVKHVELSVRYYRIRKYMLFKYIDGSKNNGIVCYMSDTQCCYFFVVCGILLFVL